MKRFIYIIPFFLITAFIIESCQHNTFIDLTNPSVSENCDPDTTYFQNEVLPLIISNCAKSGCHTSEGGGEEEAHDLSSYEAIMNSDYVDPFDANGSELIEVLTESGEDKMPPYPNEPLTSSQITILKSWINQGARNNECSGGCDTANVTYSGTIAPLMGNYCNGCHGDSGNSTGINLTSYFDSGTDDGVKTVAQDGRLWGSVNQDGGFSAMPLGGNRLQECKIDELRIWLDNGYPND